MVCNNNRYHSENTIWGISHVVNSKNDVEVAMLFTLWASLSATTQQVGKTGGHQILRCQRIADSAGLLHP